MAGEAPVKSLDMMEEDESFLSPETMLQFYRRLYPFESIFLWLNHQYQPTRQFTNREIAMSLPGDVYLRYNSFTNAADMKKSVLQLNPTRFEIGPVYTARVRLDILFLHIKIFSVFSNIAAKRQKNSAAWFVPPHTARARVRHRYDRL